jgi:ubiquitin-protein ligase
MELQLTVETGGFFRARLSFPKEYPLLPPEMVFQTSVFHPNGMCLHFLLYATDEMQFIPMAKSAFPFYIRP